MSQYVGKLERRDIGPGVWVLVTTSGNWVLRGKVPEGLAGRRVEVTGEAEDNFGFEMSGPALRVSSIRES